MLRVPAVYSTHKTLLSLLALGFGTSHTVLQLTCQGCRMLQMKETPLIRCAHNGHYNMVKYLVEQGADVNAIDLV